MKVQDADPVVALEHSRALPGIERQGAPVVLVRVAVRMAVQEDLVWLLGSLARVVGDPDRPAVPDDVERRVVELEEGS